MRKILFLLVVSATAIGLFLIKQIVVAPDQTNPVVIQQEIKQRSIEDIILDAAMRHGIDGVKFLNTAKCESSLRPDIIGDDGASIGLFQIHQPSHPDVTREQALDPEWAAEWSAKKFKINPNIWVCYQKIYKE